jgi:hypothetical protein
LRARFDMLVSLGMFATRGAARATGEALRRPV